MQRAALSHLKECLVDDSYCYAGCCLTSENRQKKIGNIVKPAGDTWCCGRVAQGIAVKKKAGPLIHQQVQKENRILSGKGKEKKAMANKARALLASI